MRKNHVSSSFGRSLGITAFSLALGALGLNGVGCSAEPLQQEEGVWENVDVAGMTYDEFKSLVYQEPDTGIYIVNGDTPIRTEAELREFYELFVRAGALIVHQVGGADSKWTDAQKTNLTYCVSTSFGANYNAMVAAMNTAVAAWEAAGCVDLIHVSAQDSNCNASNNNVVFDVSPTSGQPYLARAFFPDYPRADRNILVDSSSFGPLGVWTLAGIMRHELGHVLGFRHEHTRPESGTCFEDSNWRALTTYDSASVMHYPQCNGTQGGDLVLTALDQQGIASLYGAPGTCVPEEPPPPPPGTCSHSKCFEGEKLDANACSDTCVAQICAVDPYCCSNSWDSICVSEVASVCGETCPASCEHGKCDAGGPLDADCDPCVFQICQADPFCCTSGWDSLCIGAVETVCGDTSCNPPPPTGTCTHSECFEGEKLDATACNDTCVTQICQVDPYCCSTAWDSLCVSEVASVCGATCPGACEHDLCTAGNMLQDNCDNCAWQICQVDPYCCTTAWDSICVSEVGSVCGQACSALVSPSELEAARSAREQPSQR